MPTYDTLLIDSLLAPREDPLDSTRATVREALAEGAPGARKQVFDLANATWAGVAAAAWNEGERSPEISRICRDAKHLCEWVYRTPIADGEDRYDVGGAVTTAGMMAYILGDTEDALQRFRKILERPVNSYFHESTFEKLISVLIKEDRTDEAMVEVNRMLEVYPGNELAQNCRDAYAVDQANAAGAGAAGPTISQEAYAEVTSALALLFQKDMEALMNAGLDPQQMQERMEAAQKAYTSAVEQVSRLV